MKERDTRIISRELANLEHLEEVTIAIIGYGNQGRAQALNLRDSGIRTIIGNRGDSYLKIAREDGFEVLDITTAIVKADIVFLLIPESFGTSP